MRPFDFNERFEQLIDEARSDGYDDGAICDAINRALVLGTLRTQKTKIKEFIINK